MSAAAAKLPPPAPEQAEVFRRVFGRRMTARPRLYDRAADVPVRDSAGRRSIRPDRRHLYDQAVRGCAQVLAGARAEMADAYDRGGAMAVADLAYVPGGPSREEIAARYEALLAEAPAAGAGGGEAA